jgi:hypothetical protein
MLNYYVCMLVISICVCQMLEAFLSLKFFKTSSSVFGFSVLPCKDHGTEQIYGRVQNLKVHEWLNYCNLTFCKNLDNFHRGISLYATM